MGKYAKNCVSYTAHFGAVKCSWYHKTQLDAPEGVFSKALVSYSNSNYTHSLVSDGFRMHIRKLLYSHEVNYIQQQSMEGLCARA